MAVLEPILSERVAAACILLLEEALDEAGQHGIPLLRLETSSWGT
jgi:hypothetical protein